MLRNVPLVLRMVFIIGKYIYRHFSDGGFCTWGWDNCAWGFQLG